VINEWNGYWRFDRSWKETGLGGMVEGMSLRDLHAPIYLVVGDSELAHPVQPGERVDVPLYASFLSGGSSDSLTLRAELRGWNALGEERVYSSSHQQVPYHPWMTGPLPPLSVTMPNEPTVLVLATQLVDRAGTVLQRNFTTFTVLGDLPATVTLANGSRARVARVPAAQASDGHWSLKQWTVLGEK
jgi:hypothetical protein